MDTIGERIRTVRLEAKETQTDFAVRLGIKQNTLSLIEGKNKQTSELVLKAICREYGVNYEWLAYGIEPMRPTQSDSDIVLITRAMEGQNENKKKLIRIMADMPDELLDKMMEYLESKLK